jgi:hypothetical protein
VSTGRVWRDIAQYLTAGELPDDPAAVAGVNYVAVATGARESAFPSPVAPAMMQCRHQGFHSITSSYDPKTRILTYVRRCDACGARLADFGRIAYEPRFDPNGSDPSRAIPRPPAIDAPSRER